MQIGELSARTGASTRSLHYYEQQGLLTANRTASGHRRYPPEAVGRVLLIKELLAAGLPTRVIRAVLPCLEAPPVARTQYVFDQLAEQRRRIGAAASGLERSGRALDAIVNRLLAERATGDGRVGGSRDLRPWA